MSTDPKILMNSCLEIEGLLSLLIQRGDKVPDHLFSLLQEKAGNLLSGIKELTPDSPHVTTAEEDQIADAADFEESEDAGVNPEALRTTEAHAEQTDDACKSRQIEAERPQNTTDYEEKDSPEEEVLNGAEPKKETIETAVEHSITLRPMKFSLNDRYRFRRELFNFSDEEMDEAIEAASAMNSMEEVEDYFFNDLCWDPENDDVRDFMAIVASRFQF